MFIKNYGGEKNINEQKSIELKIMCEQEKVIITKVLSLQQAERTNI